MPCFYLFYWQWQVVQRVQNTWNIFVNSYANEQNYCFARETNINEMFFWPFAQKGMKTVKLRQYKNIQKKKKEKETRNTGWHCQHSIMIIIAGAGDCSVGPYNKVKDWSLFHFSKLIERNFQSKYLCFYFSSKVVLKLNASGLSSENIVQITHRIGK